MKPFLVEGELTGARRGVEGAGVARVPDVCCVGGDSGSAGRGGDDTADSEACSTVPVSSSSLGGALRAGVAGTRGGAGAPGCTFLRANLLITHKRRSVNFIISPLITSSK